MSAIDLLLDAFSPVFSAFFHTFRLRRATRATLHA